MTQYDQPPYTIPPLRTAYIRPLIHTDLNAVMAIDRQSYPSPRPRLAYERELKNNQMAKNFVIEWQNKDSLTILGIGGFWLLADEIHITTVAVNPDWRRLGLGEWLLVALIHAGQAAGGTVATLEVRPSNKSAQALYHKYGFTQVGRRPGYYSDTGEDGLILTTPPLNEMAYQAKLQQLESALFARLKGIQSFNVDLYLSEAEDG